MHDSNVVSRQLFDQIRWERDMALHQLAEHDIPFLGKAPDVVKVVRCKDCVHYEMNVCLKIYSDGAVSANAWQKRKPDDFCSYGKGTTI